MASILLTVALCCAFQESPGIVPNGTQDVATLLKLARTEYWRGNLVQSEVLFDSALSQRPRIDGPERALALSELGNVYVNEDKLQKAEHVYRESLQIYKRQADDAQIVRLLRSLGSLYSLQGRNDKALDVLEEALKKAKAEPAMMSEVLNNIGVVYYRLGKVSKAEKTFNEAVRFIADSSDLHARTDLLGNLGSVYHAKRQFEKAEEYLVQALKITESQVGPDHPDVTFSLTALGLMYTDAGRYADAEAHYLRALSILDPGEPVFETRRARILHSLSRAYVLMDRITDAAAALSQANAIARRNAAQHPDMTGIMDAYAATLKKDGRTKEAEELRAEARRARAAASLVINAHSPF